jgi:hypothetical protein
VLRRATPLRMGHLASLVLAANALSVAAHPSARQGRECESCRSGCGTIYMYMYLRLMAYQIKYIWGPKVV